MDGNGSFLDALVQRGVLISVSVRRWRARKKLRPEDLGLDPESVDGRLISLGHKKLVPRESLSRLALIEGRAHAAVEAATFPFLNGVARYLPNDKLEETVRNLDGLKAEFAQAADAFIAEYGTVRESALAEWAEAAEKLVPDPERLLAVIRSAFPAADRLTALFGMDVRLFRISVPDVPEAELLEAGTQQEVIRARREAAHAARSEIERSCREFVADSVAMLRSETAKLCSEMLGTINGTGSVHQKTLNRLLRFIETFGELNFADDREMAQRLESVRAEFLHRSAGEYRDSAVFRRELVGGLERLREAASDLASRDAREIVENFGRHGRRRFELVA